MTFTLTVKMDNAAFEDNHGGELRDILASMRATVCDGVTIGDHGSIRDSNGNRVGSWEIAA